jgi:ribosome-associated heat shock protein Hsp15
MEKLRLDKWLWAARFFKTRALAVDEIGKGRVHINGQPAKPAREVGAGDLISIRKENVVFHVHVRAVSSVRGPAPAAQLLYEETPESLATRQREAERRRLMAEPAQTIKEGRPTKRDRRLIDRFRPE